MQHNEYPHPIFKWAGGKSSLLETFDSKELFPTEFNRYYEPFFGAGAVFFHLYNKGLIKEASISDINVDLYNVYSLIKDHCDDLIEHSKKMDLKSESEIYYKNRNKFNDLRKKDISECSENDRLERAILMMYLNKTCYSGIYRESKTSGNFNVSFGKYKNPKIIDEENLKAVSESFKNVTISNDDFRIALKNPTKGDFVYLDPPYMPYGKVSQFIDYHHTGFGEKEQNELCRLFGSLSEKGCHLMLSNSSNPDLNDMYLQFQGVNIERVYALRLVNQKNEGRKFVREFVIKNY